MNDDIILKSVQRLSAFTRDGRGGNPAGVWIGSELPTPEIMQSTAANVGYSETAFASPETTGRTGGSSWRVRYFAPESEVDFCGHATIALGAALAESEGDGTFDLFLNSAKISVTGKISDTHTSASLQSPPTHSNLAAEELIDQICLMFDYEMDDFNELIPPAVMNAGVDHALIALNSRAKLSRMNYDLAAGRELMAAYGLTTICFAFAESDDLFHVRNAFASGGVLEDPATGAAAAAFSGYLRDLSWPGLNELTLLQGDDMGAPSSIKTVTPREAGSPIKVSGSVSKIDS